MAKLGRRSSVLLLGIAAGGALLGSVATATAATAAQAEAALVAATNSARQEAGCAPVQVDERLQVLAQAHATDMARGGYLSHTGQDGTTATERISEGAGYPRANGENIASGYPTAAEVMEAWMSSAGHRDNIEDCGFTAVGVGYVADGHHWVQTFGG